MTPNDPTFLAFLEAQRADYRRSLPQRLAQIESLWRQVLNGEAPAEALASLERCAHRLAGSGGIFGFAALGDAARVLELTVNPLLDAAHALTPTAQTEVSRAVEAFQRSVAPAGERASVLIVDDSPVKLVALGAFVARMELTIVTASSGEQALRQLLKRDFAVILLDVNMPIMDGFETAKLIRSRPRSAHTPIIFVTAEANSEAKHIRGYTLGAVDFIYSPIIPEILRAKVQVFVNLFYLQRQVLLDNEHLESLVAQRTAALTEEITERKRAQDEILRLNASLEERVQQRTAQLNFANQQLETFSYSVSHDLRSPLSTIDGFSNLLSRELGASAASERSKHYLSRIRAGASQMGELIDALLSLAQVSRTSLRWDSVDLSAMADAVVNGYRAREPGRDALLDIQPGLVAQGDARLLRQVCDNLLGNAWKFSSKQSQSLISFRLQSGPDGKGVYAVQDNGVGFDMAYSEKLFGAFQRLQTASEFAGTGIGLATVPRIIMRHGGKVWAESSPGQGSTFYFTLGSARA